MLRVFCLVLGLLGAAPVLAQEVSSVHAYVWGNSLIDHPTASEGTAVPYWLNRMAAADGRKLALSGQYVFGGQFPDKVPPEPTWGFPGVTPAWEVGESFAGIDTLLINPENFIQYKAPDAPYADPPYDGPADGRTPVSGTADLVKWALAEGAEPTVFLYEGWAEMDRFPPTRRKYRRYLEYTTGDYHDWYHDYRDGVAAALPGVDVRLIPVGYILTRLLTEGPLEALRPVDLYSDNSPHGTPTTYLIAAMITYGALYNAPPPADFAAFEDVHPLLQETYRETAAFIWAEMEDFAAPRRTAARAPADPPVKTAEAPAAEPVPPGIGLANPSIAMGLNGVADWSTQAPFMDMMKTARPWTGHKHGQWGGWSAEDLEAKGYLDDNGWITRLPPDVDRIEAFLLTDLPPEAESLAGRYRMTWEGTGKIQIVGRARVRKREGREIWFDFEPGEGTVAIQINETDPEGSGDHIRNIRILHEDHLALDAAGAVFNPAFLARIADLRALRFMDWTFTNGSAKRVWADRAQVADYTYVRRGVPVEHLVWLANLVGADPWFNMPHQADDDFIRRYAAAVQEALDPRLMAHVEYSNEVWNRVFPQAGWAVEQAEARWGAAAGDDAWMQFAGMRAAQVADIWTGVFGPEAAARLVNVVGVHTGWPGLEEPQLDAPLWQAEGADAPAGRFQAYAVSGYFGHLIGGEEGGARIKALLEAQAEAAREAGEASGLRRVALREYVRAHRFDGVIAPVIADLRAGSLRELTEELWPYHAAVAERHDMRMIMYEGGTHILGHGPWQEDEDMTAFFHQLNYAPEMGEVYGDLLQDWKAAGGTLFNAFVDIGKPSKFGSWGNLRHLDDATPRWDALMAFNRDVPAWWEARAEGAFLQGVTRRGTPGKDRLEGTGEEDFLFGLNGNDVLVSHGRGDVLHGGPGEDIAILPGAYADYGFDMERGTLRAWHRNGVVHLHEIEVLRFDDLDLRTDALQ